MKDAEKTICIFKKEDYETIAIEIKNKLLEKKEYVILKNNDVLLDEDEIIEFYTKLNPLIGEIKEIDKEKYVSEIDDFWVEIEFNKNKLKKQNNLPWKSNKNLFLHTDNTLSNINSFANLTELVCIYPSTYSGETFFISNNKIIEVLQYMDEINNTNLWNEIKNANIYHKNKEGRICFYNEKIKNYTFNFNIEQIRKSEHNILHNLEIANKFASFLENIINSSLIHEIRLEKGDAIIFNDTLVMHGRKYVFGNRLYKKCSINLDIL